MGLKSWVRRTFGDAPSREFNYESAPYSLLIRGMFGQQPNGRASLAGREEAMTIPAVLRGRNLICGISNLPLEEIDPFNRVQRNLLLEQIDPNVANVVTLASTIEDLLFDGVAWWRVAARSGGRPSSAVQYATSTVSMTPPPGYKTKYLPSDLPTEGVVWMGGEEVPYSDVIRFDSPNPPLMRVAAQVVLRAISLSLAAQGYADNPRPQDYFSPADPTNGDPFGEDSSAQVEALLAAWAEARRRSSTAYVPAALKYNAVQQPTPADLQLAQLQSRVNLDLANMLGLDPEEVGESQTSRTYQNATDRRKDKINELLAPFMSAISQRLTMLDVTRRGYKVRFGLNEYLQADPLTRAQVSEIQIRNGVVTREWVAARVEGLPPEAVPVEAPGQQQMEPAPERQPIDAGEATVGEPIELARRAYAAAFKRDGGMTFARESITFDAPEVDAAFVVDEGRRIIVGLAVPWNQTARNGGMHWRFARGGAKYSAINRVKLLRDHDFSQLLGKALKIEDTDAGLVVTFKVAPGADGDRALALAADGTLDGLSIGVDFREEDFAPDPEHPGAMLVRQYALREVSLTGMPAFDDSRLTSVRASDEGREPAMPDQETTETAPATQPAPATPTPAPAAQAPVAESQTPQKASFSMDDVKAIFGMINGGQTAAIGGQVQPAQPVAPETVPVVDPTTREVRVAATAVSEPLPYRFHYQPGLGGKSGRHVFRSDAEYDFSTDLFDAINNNDKHGGAAKRVNALVKAAFADVDTTDVAGLIPKVQRPDMWYPQRDYATPLWDLTGSGTTDGRPFELPKYNSSSGLVSAATEGVEPDVGAFTVTTQTVTPTALWGKVEITRHAIRRGGNPQISAVIWDQMLRSYSEAREAAIATFLATLTAAADITLTVPTGTADNDEDQATVASFLAAIADLQFIRGGNTMSAFAAHQFLYRIFARVTDDAGRPLFPMINPQNANGQTTALYKTMDVGGTTVVGAYALGAATGTDPVNSWLFDPAVVRTWASQPERLDWDFGATVQSSTRIPQLSEVTMGIWGDIAVANIDINGVRQVITDPVGS
jgi:HK97 family phage prohead protease